MSDPIRVLVLDDEPIVGERLKEHFEKQGMSVEVFTESQAAIECLGRKRFDVVVTDLKMKGPDGLEVMHFVRRQGLGTQVIIITGYSSIEAALEAEYSGVFEFVDKPFQMETITKLVQKAAAKARKLARGART
jgi:DNA-binding NtrC family response regulator